MKTQRFGAYKQWVQILFPVFVSVIMLWPLKDSKINPDLKSYLPKSIGSRVDLEKMDSIFGNFEPVLIFFETNDILNDSTLNRISSLTEIFEASEHFNRVLSLANAKNISTQDGMMVVEPVLKNCTGSLSEKEELRKLIRSNPLAYKLLVSEDFRHTLLMVNPVNLSDKEAIQSIQQILTSIPGCEKTYLNGNAYMRYEVQRSATRDLILLMPIGLLIMILFLYISFHEWKGVMLPFAVVVMSIALALGLMPLLGYDLSLIAVLIPILMIAIANNYGVYIISRYQELNARYPGMSMNGIVQDAFSHLWKPILFTALTTIAGILGMAFTTMLPARQMGLVCSAGIAFALFLSLFFIPPVLRKLRKGKPQKSFLQAQNSPVDKVLDWAGRTATSQPVIIVVVFTFMLVAGGSGIKNLQVSINNEKMLPASHPLRISTGIADDRFGGTKTLSILFEGDCKSPEIAYTMDRFEKELKNDPLVGNVTSLATVVRAISRALNEKCDSLYDRIPQSRDAIAQYLELFSMSTEPADLEQLVDFNYQHAAFNVQFSATNIRDFKHIERKIRQLAGSSPYCKLVAGNCLIEKEFAESIVYGQIASLVFAFVAIIILLTLIFRSPAAGLMGSIPLVFSILINFGIMGWIGFKLDIATSMISSIAIGLGVDYTIHMFWRIRHELSMGKTHTDSIRHTLLTTGRGITINAFAVMAGFSILFFSRIVLLQSFALLIILSLLMCLFCALVLIPSILLLTKPRFLLQPSKSHFNKS